jgi:hypothetical protein
MLFPDILIAALVASIVVEVAVFLNLKQELFSGCFPEQ